MESIMKRRTTTATLLGVLLSAQSATAAVPQTRWLITFDEPAATAFESTDQLPNHAKSQGLFPTAKAMTGSARFDANRMDVRKYRSWLTDRRHEHLDRMSQLLGRHIVPTAHFDLAMNGVVLKLTEVEADRIHHMAGIASIAPETTLAVNSAPDAAYTGAAALWQGQVPGFTSGARGAGVVVGVVDSGITFDHPSFADVAGDGHDHSNPHSRRFGLCTTAADPRCNDKLIGVHDFVNEPGATGSSAGLDLSGHGTRVAGTIAGNPLDRIYFASGHQFDVVLSGVAPRANLIAYKACRATDVPNQAICTNTAIVAALNQAIADGVDVLNLSIGQAATASPWADPTQIAQVMLNVRSAGITVVAPAGNDGASGEPAMSTPGYAPWVLAGANTNSNLQFTMKLANIFGTGVQRPFALTGNGISPGTIHSGVVDAEHAGFPTCGTGASQGSQPTGASNPFSAGQFSDKIVVCMEGAYSIAEQAHNVAVAGARGLVVVTDRNEGVSRSVDVHTLPTVHLSFDDGKKLKDAIRTARSSNGEVRAGIEPTLLTTEGAGSILAPTSSVGPAPFYDGVLKPDLSAPGTNIMALDRASEIGLPSTGTSYSSAHLSGAAALLLSAHPEWTVDQVVSAMVTSAERNVTRDDKSRAWFVEAGAGQLDVRDAVRSGLHLRVTTNQFTNANPAIGGQPSDLNLPALHRRSCAPNCTFTRAFTANVGGTWRVEATVPYGTVTVQPSELQLAFGQTAAVTVTVTPPADGAGWIDGVLRLAPVGQSDLVSATELPISVFSQVAANPLGLRQLGTTVVGTSTTGSHLTAAAPEWMVRDSELKILSEQPITLRRDATPADPYDSIDGNALILIPRLETTSGGDPRFTYLYAETAAADERNLDVFVGIDRNEDGRPQASEELCRGITEETRERCLIRAEFPSFRTRYWVMVRGLADGDAANGAPTLKLYHGARDGGPDPAFTAMATRGALTAGQPANIRLNWNLQAFAPGTTAMTVLSQGASRDSPDRLSLRPILLTRDNNTPTQPIVLDSADDSQTIVLAPGQAHETIVVDVPPNQTSLSLLTEGIGGNVDLFVSRVTEAPAPPTFPTAPPRAQQPMSSVGPGNSETVAVSRAQLLPGRYHVTPVNVGATSATITIGTHGEFSSTIQQPAANGYFNPARSGHGVFLAKTAEVWALAWYTFDASGSPVWYTAQAAVPGSSAGTWKAPLYRSTWNGVRDNPHQVGDVLLTFSTSTAFTFSWTLNGVQGSEPFVAIGTPVCANGSLSVGGGWLRPDQSGWGSYFLNFPGNLEAEAIYVYDSFGMPRWVIGEGTFATTLTKPIFQVSGFCPECAFAPTTRTRVGDATRTLISGTSGLFSSDIALTNGVGGNWVQNNVAWTKLTPDLACP